MSSKIANSLSETKLCECGCGSVIPAINKLGKSARFKHGHNITRSMAQYARSKSPGHIQKHTGDYSRFGKHRIGISPTNAIQKGQHISPGTEYKPGNIPSEKNRHAVSIASKEKWANDPEYRKICSKAAISVRKNTSLEKTVRGFLDELKIKHIDNMWFRFEKIPGKKHGCEPDIRIEDKGLKIVIHCDGYRHTILKQIKKDKYTDQKLRERGYEVLRLTAKQIKQLTKERLKIYIDAIARKRLAETYAYMKELD